MTDHPCPKCGENEDIIMNYASGTRVFRCFSCGHVWEKPYADEQEQQAREIEWVREWLG